MLETNERLQYCSVFGTNKIIKKSAFFENTKKERIYN